MNKVILIGNLTRDPEVTQAGEAIKCAFTVAVQRRYASTGGERIADFINVIAWRQLGEICAKYLAKGRKVGVEGRIQTRSYTAQDGTKRYVTEVIAESVEFLTAKSSGGGQPRDEAAEPGQSTGGSAERQAKQMNFTEVDDDDLPW